MNTLPHPINTREELAKYLQVAIQIEHATIPPYLTALCSIRADETRSNVASSEVIRAVLVEEMLHMTLAANLLNAIGGAPNLVQPGFVPRYPTYLPTGETDFEVGIDRFSRSTLETFLKIERPTPPAGGESLVMINDVAYVKHEFLANGRKRRGGLLPHHRPMTPKGGELVLHFWSIAEFYNAIAAGFRHLSRPSAREPLFQGKVQRQVTPDAYYSSGGDVIVVTDLDSALKAIDLISGQGEGSGGRIYDEGGELSHYYRFDQIRRERYYQVGSDPELADKPDQPTGEPLKVYWDEVYPMRANLKVADLPAGSQVRSAAIAFNRQYKSFLQFLHDAFNGRPESLSSSYSGMFAIKEAALRLIHTPLPTGGGNAAPTFEVDYAGS